MSELARRGLTGWNPPVEARIRPGLRDAAVRREEAVGSHPEGFIYSAFCSTLRMAHRRGIN